MARILLVDDHPELLWSLQIALEGENHLVSLAHSASGAIEVLCRQRVELVITDYEMPGMNGAQLCWWLRAHPAYSAVPVIMLSGAPEPIGSVRCWDRFLSKPAGLGDIFACIDALAPLRLVSAVPTPRARGTRAAMLRCQYPSASRWTAINPQCWP